MSLLTAIFILVLVMDPLGNVPIFLVALKNVPPHRRKRIIFRESLIALGALLLLLCFGRIFLNYTQFNETTLGIAGGIILFLIALKMIFSPTEEMIGPTPDGEPLIVPLAIPLIAGPSAAATLLLFVSREPGRFVHWILALLAAWGVTCAILMLSAPLSRLLKERGLLAMERLMGMVLTLLAVQMFLAGLRKFLETL